jgi:hypothetical protein
MLKWVVHRLMNIIVQLPQMLSWMRCAFFSDAIASMSFPCCINTRALLISAEAMPGKCLPQWCSSRAMHMQRRMSKLLKDGMAAESLRHNCTDSNLNPNLLTYCSCRLLLRSFPVHCAPHRGKAGCRTVLARLPTETQIPSLRDL